MHLEPLANVAEIAERAAAIIAERARVAFRERGRFTIALSGGPSTTEMIHRWGRQEVPWGKVFVFEISEPIPPPGHPAAYFPRLREALVQDTPIDPRQIYPMPVSAVNPLVGIRNYARKMERLAGCPAVIDLIYVALDTDGDVLKLVPGNPMLQATNGDIGIALYQEKKRMTFTYSVFKRARQIVWVVTETDTAKALLELDSAAVDIQGSPGRRDYALIFADHAVRETRLAASRRVQ